MGVFPQLVELLPLLPLLPLPPPLPPLPPPRSLLLLPLLPSLSSCLTLCCLMSLPAVERQHFRLAALRECHTSMWKAGTSALPYEAGKHRLGGGAMPPDVPARCTDAGGQLLPPALVYNSAHTMHHLLALPAAVWLLEEEEEIKGGHVPVGGQVRRGRHLHGMYGNSRVRQEPLAPYPVVLPPMHLVSWAPPVLTSTVSRIPIASS